MATQRDSAESEMDIGMVKEVRKRPGELKIKTGKGRMKKMHKKIRFRGFKAHEGK